MQEFFTYLIKSSGLIIAFFLAYHFLLRKETFFTSNRWFLLSGLVISALLPLFFIKRIVFIEQPKISTDNLITTSKESISNVPEITQEVATLDWYQIIAIGYGIIVFILLIKVIINLFSLSKLLLNKKIKKQERFTLVDLQEDIAPFSFFNYIVFNSSLYSDNELENILLHEKIHSKEKHSFDVLLSKLFTILFWFNPIVWLYKKSIVQNLEYIADSKAIQLIEDKKSYQKALLKVVSHQNCLPITNHFYQSLIKKRIIMLNKNQSNKRNSWKYAVVLPALICFVLLFQIKVVAQDKAEIIDYNTNSDIIDLAIKFESTSKDKDLLAYKNIFKDYDISINFSEIIRNSESKITGIKIEMKSLLDGSVKKLELNDQKPINAISLYTTKLKNGKWNFGIKQIEHNELTDEGKNQLKDINIDLSTEKNDGYWSINEIKIESIKLLIYIDGEKQDDANPIKISNDKELDKIEKILDKEKLKKYGEDGKNGVALVSTKNNETIKTADNAKEQLIIINDEKTIEKNEVEGKKSVSVFNRNTKTESTSLLETPQEKKIIIFSNDNGDDIVFIPSEKILKIPHYPTVKLNEDGLVLIINGVYKTNPLETLNQMNLQNVKSIRVYDENGKETAGTPIKKIIITTK
ncbi:M56 family metallopeptidase [Flavobacterium sp.]|uniref:M56 family metallopeptidase n=1 Tax=Flavobacterium sp. TaxID=239 RepID=UPI003750274F